MNNYEMMKEKMQSVFLTFDQQEMIARFSLAADDDWLSFPFMGFGCRIHRSAGRVECQDVRSGQFRAADYNESMTVFDLLCYSQRNATPAGEFVPMQSLAQLQTASRKLRGDSFFLRQADAFDTETEKLPAAIEFLGGRLVSGGDVCGEFHVFSDLRMRMRFWRSDEEFAPEIQFLWDANVLQYMHYETAWFANHVLINNLSASISCLPYPPEPR